METETKFSEAHPSEVQRSPKPDLNFILSISSDFNIIPIVKEISGDMDTPISLFSPFQKEKIAFFFESAEGAGKWGRFSYICLNPLLTVNLKNNVFEINKFDGKKVVSSEKFNLSDIREDIFVLLKKTLSE